MFGTVKGYDIFTANKRKISKPAFTAKLVGDADEIRANATEALASHGVAYGLRNKDNECVCLYCFKKVLVADTRQKRLILTSHYAAEGMEEVDEKFVENIRAELIDLIVFTGVNSVEWDGAVIDAEDVEKAAHKGGEGSGMMWIVLGIIFWLCMDVPLLGIVFIMLGAGKVFSNVDWKKSESKKDTVESVIEGSVQHE
ncbi:hypothetical protein [Ruminococcus sp.]|uniref:hypothetical protein n=1 Tax=Ruminococcus sp. TaxID=41978 RepID=UPI0025D4B2A4|nr:hypothetical protein [Ruminococcus sp.]MBQ8966136.1 hypothetical protein [Ruminococcus sp.]